MKACATWEGGYRTLLEDDRGHTVTIDLPADEGGGDLGTSALELAVLSLAGCVTTIFTLVAARRKLRFEAMRLEVDAMRPRGARTIASVEGTFHLATSAPEEEVATALEITLRNCPVGVLFHQAGIPTRIRLAIDGSPRKVGAPTPEPVPA